MINNKNKKYVSTVVATVKNENKDKITLYIDDSFESSNADIHNGYKIELEKHVDAQLDMLFQQKEVEMLETDIICKDFLNNISPERREIASSLLLIQNTILDNPIINNEEITIPNITMPSRTINNNNIVSPNTVSPPIVNNEEISIVAMPNLDISPNNISTNNNVQTNNISTNIASPLIQDPLFVPSDNNNIVDDDSIDKYLNHSSSISSSYPSGFISSSRPSDKDDSDYLPENPVNSSNLSEPNLITKDTITNLNNLIMKMKYQLQNDFEDQVGDLKDELNKFIENVEDKININKNVFRTEITTLNNKFDKHKTNLNFDWNTILKNMRDELDSSLKDMNDLYIHVRESIVKLRSIEQNLTRQILPNEFMDNVTKRLDNMERLQIFRGTNYNCDRCQDRLNMKDIYFVNCCCKYVVCYRCSTKFVKKTTACHNCVYKRNCECLQHIKCIM